jgi:lysophospholipase L1-like esterase
MADHTFYQLAIASVFGSRSRRGMGLAAMVLLISGVCDRLVAAEPVVKPDDPFFANFNPAPLPASIPFALNKGDRLHLIGDSITDTRRYARIIETYLTVAMPQLAVETRNLGRGGEKSTEFIKRMDKESLIFHPTVATICYGMNDSGYINNNRNGAKKFHESTDALIQRFQAAKVRVVLGAPGCLGRLPPWSFVTQYKGTFDGLNTTLMLYRDETAALAGQYGLPFVDTFWNLFTARFVARKYGPDYAVCGASDGVHPSWAGHVVMAYGFLKALGMEGDLGTFTLDLAKKSAAVGQGHVFVGADEKEGIWKFKFTSSRYPFCATGPTDKDYSIRSGMTLVPFNQELNRMTLKVGGTAASQYRVTWVNEEGLVEDHHVYTAAQLAAGVNLADEFEVNPFTVPFNRIDELVLEKQTIEHQETWHRWDKGNSEQGLAEYEAKRNALMVQIKQAFVPVTHSLVFEALP